MLSIKACPYLVDILFQVVEVILNEKQVHSALISSRSNRQICYDPYFSMKHIESTKWNCLDEMIPMSTLKTVCTMLRVNTVFYQQIKKKKKKKKKKKNPIYSKYSNTVIDLDEGVSGRYFSYSQKHMLWVLIRSALWGSSNEYHNIRFDGNIRKILAISG